MWTLLLTVAFASAADINGPPWATFGSSLQEAAAAGESPSRITTAGSGMCFTDRRKVVDMLWHVEVCASDGKTIDRVRLMSSRDAESAILNVQTKQGKLDEIKRRAREALESQYGAPLSSMDEDLRWRDRGGDEIVIRQETVSIERMGRYDAVVIMYGRKASATETRTPSSGL
jgi:hypothetical protein